MVYSLNTFAKEVVGNGKTEGVVVNKGLARDPAVDDLGPARHLRYTDRQRQAGRQVCELAGIQRGRQTDKQTHRKKQAETEKDGQRQAELPVC